MIYPHLFQDLSKSDFLKSVGLYLMRDRLYLVRMRKDLFRVSLMEMEAREIPLGEDEDLRRQALGETIRSLLPHFNPAKDPFYICISMDQAIGRQVFLPQVAEENLRQVIDYEIERIIPFPRDEVYYNFMPTRRKGNKTGIFLFAIPKKTLDEILNVLAAFGISPKGVETTATALSNYLLFCERDFMGTALVLDGHDQGWEMIGFNSDANARSNSNKAELLFSHWLPGADWIQGPAREIFHSSLRSSSRFFGSVEIKDFFLSLKEEPPQVEELLTVGKERLAPGKEITDSSFIPAIGTALRGLREATFSVNLLPGATEERRGRTFSWVNTLLGILILIGLFTWGAGYYIREEMHLRQIQKEVQRLKPSVEALHSEEEDLKRLHNETSLLSGFNRQRGELLLVLDELSNIVPNSAYLSSLHYREGTIELQGNAENASNLVPVLERSLLFKNVGFNAPSNRGRDNRETFSLKAELERQEAGDIKP